MKIFNSIGGRALPAARPKSPIARAYRMRAKANNVGEIYLYGNIGASFWSDGITAKEFSDDLKAMGNVTEIQVRINSEGGDVFEGRTMYSLLAEHKAKKVVYVDGLAASIASLIAMAGNEIIMGDGTFIMIHNAWGMAVGDSNEMKRMAALLDSVTSTLIDTYSARTKNEYKAVKKMMDDETWLTATEAKDKGFATKVSEPVKAVARVFTNGPYQYKNLPASLRPNRASALRLIENMKRA